MKKAICLLVSAAFCLLLFSSCSHTSASPDTTSASISDDRETTANVSPETPPDITGKTDSETPINSPVTDPWETAVWSKEPWWENVQLLFANMNAATPGSLVIAEDIQTQENDTLLAVEAMVRAQDGLSSEDLIALISSLGFEPISYSGNYTKFCVFLATKEQLMNISLPEEYTIGFKLAFASKGFYTEMDADSMYNYGKQLSDGGDKLFGIFVYVKLPHEFPYSISELWENARAKHPLPPPLDGNYDYIALEANVTSKQLHELFISDGFFDDCRITIFQDGIPVQSQS